MVLKMYWVREVDAASSPHLYNMVAELARRAELPDAEGTSSTRAQPTPSPPARNPDNAAVAATTASSVYSRARATGGVMAQ